MTDTPTPVSEERLAEISAERLTAFREFADGERWPFPNREELAFLVKHHESTAALLDERAAEIAAKDARIAELRDECKSLWDQGMRHVAVAVEERARATAAEAREAAMRSHLTCAKQQCETVVYNITQREHDPVVVSSFQSIADYCARAAIASSPTQEDATHDR